MIGICVLFLFTLCSVSKADDGVNCPDVENKDEVVFTFNSKCYHIVESIEEQVTYFSAERDCIQRDGHLVNIKDNATQVELVSQLQFLSDSHTVIIGLNKVGNKWKWISGDGLNYTNWERNSHCNGTCNCAKLKLSSGGGWEPFVCDTSDWYTVHVCEYGSSGFSNQGEPLAAALLFGMVVMVTKICAGTSL